MTITPVSKNSISITPNGKTPSITWDEATMTWDEAQGTWDNAIKPLVLPNKNNISLTLATK